ESHPGLFPPTFGAVAPLAGETETTGTMGMFQTGVPPCPVGVSGQPQRRGSGAFPEIPKSAASRIRGGGTPPSSHVGRPICCRAPGKRNTFQAVLASSGSSSYAIFLYPEDGLQFTSTFSKRDQSQVPAMVAFSQGLVGRVLSSDGAYNIFANDRDSIGNLAKSSNSGQQGVWVFEIGGPDTASGVVSSDVILRADDGEDYDDDEDYDSVTSLGPEDLGTTPFPHETPRRGDTGTTRHRVLSPSRPATARPARPPTERTRSFQLPGARFPQQHPQVIDVDEVEESEVVFSYNTDSRPTCANSRHQCSVHAECRDYATGFCCSCV
uniref:NIDO domain-containing protein n=1 Tax=Myotis lucifugus TaxID=59463 RepID=G1Q1H6_MYOLU